MSTKIGVSSLHYALLTSDELDATPVYATPVAIPGVIGMTINPNTSTETLFADDGPYEAASTLGEIEVEMNAADFDLDQQAALLGHTVTAGVLKRLSTDAPPYVAVGFKSLKSNGAYRFTWLAKGKFAPSEQSHETKGDTVNFQTPTLTGAFLKRTGDDEWERHIDEDHVDWIQAYSDDWFNGPTAVG